MIEQQVSPAGSTLIDARWRQPGIVLVKPDETGGVNVEHVEAAGRARGDSREGPTGLVDRTRCRSEMASGRERSFGKGTGKAWQLANHLESVTSYYFQLHERPVALRIASAAVLLRAVLVTSHRRNVVVNDLWAKCAWPGCAGARRLGCRAS